MKKGFRVSLVLVVWFSCFSGLSVAGTYPPVPPDWSGAWEQDHPTVYYLGLFPSQSEAYAAQQAFLQTYVPPRDPIFPQYPVDNHSVDGFLDRTGYWRPAGWYEGDAYIKHRVVNLYMFSYPVNSCATALYADRNPLRPGETARVWVDPVITYRNYAWSIAGTRTARARISGSGSSAVVYDVSGEGELTILARDQGNPSCSLQGQIKVACGQCAGNCTLGTGNFRIGSIDAEFSLGKARADVDAGSIVLRAETPSPSDATPAGLDVLSIADVRTYYAGSTLRQVVAPETLVDVEVIDEFSYTITFYPRGAADTKAINGIFPLLPGATPTVVWTIENPDRSSTAFNRLRITETRGGGSTTREYVWDEASSTWSLAEGEGLRVTSKAETVVGDRRIAREVIRDAEAQAASDVQTAYRSILGGGVSREEVVERIEDPEGDALTTTIAYYEDGAACPVGSCGRIRSQENPDGSWVRYEYDAQGRKTAEVHSWLDEAPQAAASAARLLSYDYAPVDPADSLAPEDSALPRRMTESILGTVVSRTYRAYIKGSGERTEIVERAATPVAAYGNPANERTVTTYYLEASGLPWSGRVKSVRYPDGRLDTHGFEQGTYTPAQAGEPGVFVTGPGTDIREQVTHGTGTHPEGIAGKSTRMKTVRDRFGHVFLEETYVFTGSSEERISWTSYTLDSLGRPTQMDYSNGTRTESSWGCCSKNSDTDALGIQTTYDYDDLKRVLTETRPGPQGDIVTAYAYDAAGRVLSTAVAAGGLTQTAGQQYDLAGRLRFAADAVGLVTSYSYPNSGRTASVTRPGGATEATERYLDGRVKSVTGTAVVARYYVYGVNSDGTQWTLIREGSPDSPHWEKTTTDMLGRTIRIEKPGYLGAEVTEHFYSAGGRLLKTTAPGQAPLLYTYDELGEQVWAGLDIDGDGVLAPGSKDRIDENVRSFVWLDGSWWQETDHRMYATDDDATATLAAVERTKLTGLGGSGLVRESVSIDPNGNQTVSQVFIDRAVKTEWKLTSYPDSATDSVETSVIGYLSASQSKTGVTTTFQYDALGRRTGVADPRTGTTVTRYNNKGQVDWVEDPAHRRTSYTYSLDTGRLATETNALNHVTRYAYNDRGQLTNTWGDAAYPVRYVYDDLGRKTEMHTWRAGDEEAWNTVQWPSPEPVGADVTRWHYDATTGLLVAKEDAAGRSVSYGYTWGGKIESRTWARADGENALVTTYGYDSMTGEIKTIDYSDATPDVAFTYDRLGRQKTATDAVGTRAFAYRPDLQPDTETITGLYDKIVKRTYEPSGPLGRPNGFAIDSDYQVAYGYDPTGRLDAVSWTANGTADTVAYTRIPSSDLVETLSAPQGLTVTYSYEPTRNLRTELKNEIGPALISNYGYQYNALGQRESATSSGKAFARALTLKLAGAAWFATAQNTGSGIELLPEHRDFSYDPIGNRKTATDANPDTGALRTTTYAANVLNQYDQTTSPELGTQTFGYDEDGNLTSNGATRYIFDAENRLTTVEPQTPTAGSKKVTFLYDYMGRRVQKKVYTYSGGWSLASDTRYVYDGWNVVQELNASGQVLKSYVWGLDLSNTLQGAGGIGGLLASVEGSSTYYFLYDGNGNVGQLVNAADGSIAAHYEYDPYGNVTFSNGALAGSNPYRFSTKPVDPETGLSYYGYRYYSAGLGRWLNRDPILEQGFSSTTFQLAENRAQETSPSAETVSRSLSWSNPLEKSIGRTRRHALGQVEDSQVYQFADGDPVNAVDPNGLLTVGAGVSGFAGVAGAAGNVFVTDCCDKGRKTRYLAWNAAFLWGVGGQAGAKVGKSPMFGGNDCPVKNGLTTYQCISGGYYAGATVCWPYKQVMNNQPLGKPSWSVYAGTGFHIASYLVYTRVIGTWDLGCCK